MWDELRSVSLKWHHGMSYGGSTSIGGLQWPCPDEDHPGTPLLHARLWAADEAERGAPAPFMPVEHVPPVDALTDEFPIRLTTVRVLDALQLRRADRRVRLAAAPPRVAADGRLRGGRGSASPTASGCG